MKKDLKSLLFEAKYGRKEVEKKVSKENLEMYPTDEMIDKTTRDVRFLIKNKYKDTEKPTEHFIQLICNEHLLLNRRERINNLCDQIKNIRVEWNGRRRFKLYISNPCLNIDS